MLMSMTGYGRAERHGTEGHCTVEVRSVNHRYCEIAVRLPRGLIPLETRIREQVRHRFARGRFDVAISLDVPTLIGQVVHYNRGLVTQYLRTLEALQTDFRLPGTIDLSTLLQFRDILQVEESPPDFEAVWAFLSPPLDEALAALARMREREGSSLETDIAQRLAIIGQHSQQIAERVPLMADAYRERLQQRITELLEEGEVDPNRLAQEVVFFAERSDISEELTRLHSHIQEFRHIMTQPEPVGRKLDFLAQEMHREINTIGAKANDSTIAQVVVHMKSELEKIREQIQNIE